MDLKTHLFSLLKSTLPFQNYFQNKIRLSHVNSDTPLCVLCYTFNQELVHTNKSTSRHTHFEGRRKTQQKSHYNFQRQWFLSMISIVLIYETCQIFVPSSKTRRTRSLNISYTISLSQKTDVTDFQCVSNHFATKPCVLHHASFISQIVK